MSLSSFVVFLTIFVINSVQRYGDEKGVRMSKLTKETIKKLTQLSRIACTEEEQESLLRDLEKVLVYFEQLNEIDTENVEPCNHVIPDIVNVMREDEVGPTLPQEEFFRNAPAKPFDGMIRVPPVLKQG